MSAKETMKIRYLVTDRWGGVSEPPYHTLNLALHVGDDPQKVAINRQILAKRVGHPIQYANQVHGDRIAVVDRIIDPPTCDGLLTQKANLALAILTADCYGVLLFDQKRSTIAALHAGRAGAAKGIVSKALSLMKERYGCEDIAAILSPGICQKCYDIGNLAKTYPKRFLHGTHLDVKAMIEEQLREGGVEWRDFGICTSCDPDYFSYRRDGATGRFASVIWMEEG